MDKTLDGNLRIAQLMGWEGGGRLDRVGLRKNVEGGGLIKGGEV